MIWVVSLLAMNLITHSLTAVHHVFGIRSLIGFGKSFDPQSNQCSTPRGERMRLYLNIFRGEPAITELD